MRRLILIRHSSPQIEEEIPAKKWHLSEGGRARCTLLAQKLESHPIDRIISSLEPKAMETAELIANALGKPYEAVEGLHEHDRSNVGFLGSAQFTSSVMRFFEQPNQLVLGSETANQAHERFAGVVADVIQQYPSENLAIVAHGTVISLFVARAAGLEPVPLWKRLGLPSFVVLAMPGPRIVSVVESVEARR